MVVASTAVLAGGQTSSPAAEIAAPTGTEVAQLQTFDKLVRSFLEEHKIPGAALAIAYQGKLVYSRGFGLADVEAQIPVQPRSMFRIASISKPLTAAAVMQLVERGKLKLDDPVFDLLDSKPFLRNGRKVDPRLKKITVRHCLQHTGGWDRGESYDAMFIPLRIAEEMNIEPPVEPRDIIRYMQGQPLDFDPGAKYAYSNLGYCILGRVIEKVTGMPYGEYMEKEVFQPLGMHETKLGHSLPEKQLPGEVKYYAPGRTSLAVVGDRLARKVPSAYGGYYLESMDAHGGYVSTAPDLVRFASAVLGDPSRCPLLKPHTIAEMLQRPAGPPGLDDQQKPASEFYACGWRLENKTSGGGRILHNGSLPGTSTSLVHRRDGVTYAILFNCRNVRGKKDDDRAVTVFLPEMEKAVDQIESWPDAPVSASDEG